MLIISLNEDQTGTGITVERNLRALGISASCVDPPSPSAKRAFEQQLRVAKALILVIPQLDWSSLRSPVGELATSARQLGVPTFAIVEHNELDAFGARMLDFQLVLEVHTNEQVKAATTQIAATFHI